MSKTARKDRAMPDENEDPATPRPRNEDTPPIL